MKHLALTLAMAFAASAASAAIVSTNNFETSYDGFSADGGDIASLVSLDDYQDGQPSGSAPAPFSDIGSAYMSLDTPTTPCRAACVRTGVYDIICLHLDQGVVLPFGGRRAAWHSLEGKAKVRT